MRKNNKNLLKSIENVSEKDSALRISLFLFLDSDAFRRLSNLSFTKKLTETINAFAKSGQHFIISFRVLDT